MVNGAQNPLLIMTEELIRGWTTSAFEELMQDREGYGGTWLNEATYPQYGCLGAAKIRRVFIDVWLEGGETE